MSDHVACDILHTVAMRFKVNAIFVTNYLQGGIDEKEFKVIIIPICVCSVLCFFLYTRTCIYHTPMAFLIEKKSLNLSHRTHRILCRFVRLEKFSFKNMKP